MTLIFSPALCSCVRGIVLLTALVGASAVSADAGHDHGRDDAEEAHGHAGDDHAHGHGTGFAAGRPGAPDEVDRTIRIEAQDIAFSAPRITVRAGETVRFVIENTGEMVHDFTVGTIATQAAHRAKMAEMMAHHPDPEAMMAAHDHGGANAVMLAPGATEELIWTFERAEDIEFACNVPGHYEAGMHGDIAVR